MKKTNNLADFDRLFGDEIKEVQRESDQSRNMHVNWNNDYNWSVLTLV